MKVKNDISFLIKEKQRQVENLKSEILEEIYFFFKDNGIISPYFLNRKISEKTLIDNRIYELNDNKILELKKVEIFLFLKKILF